MRLAIFKKSGKEPIGEVIQTESGLELFGNSPLGITLNSSASLESLQSIINSSKLLKADLIKDEAPEPQLTDPTKPNQPVEMIASESINARISPALQVIKDLLNLAQSKRKEEAEIDAVKESVLLDQQNAEKVMEKPSQMYVSVDGDNIGNAVARAEAQDNEEEMREVSSRITSGQGLLQQWAVQQGGQIIQSGGDEGLVKVPSAALDHMEELRVNYKSMVGATLTVGVGETISQSTKARMLGKLRGKNQVCYFDENTERELELRLKEKDSSEEEKVKTSGVIQ